MATKASFSHEITVALPFAATMPLFTPRGEEAWVPGWAPHYIDPPDGETREGMLFTTGEGDLLTFWTCLAWDPMGGHARYLRLTPASRVAFVDVQVAPDGDHRARVRVRYEMTALTEAGRTQIEAMTEAGFAEMIEEWAVLIAKGVATGQIDATKHAPTQPATTP